MSDLHVPGRSSVTKSNNTLPAMYNLKYSSSSIKKNTLWWHIHLVLTLGRLRQKEQELTWIILDYVLLALLAHLKRFFFNFFYGLFYFILCVLV